MDVYTYVIVGVVVRMFMNIDVNVDVLAKVSPFDLQRAYCLQYAF